MRKLGVTIDSNLFEDHNTEKVNKAYSVVGLIKRNCEHIGKDAFVLLYKSMVRSHLGVFKLCGLLKAKFH